jgi:hypothetical protein
MLGGGTAMKERPGTRIPTWAALACLSLSVFSCSYGDEEEDDDRKHKNHNKADAILSPRPAAGPAAVVLADRRGKVRIG